MLRIVVLAVFIASGLYGLRESGALDQAGLLGHCDAVKTAAITEGEWLGCRGGRLNGAPDLSHDGCRKGATQKGVTYWYCPEKLVSDRNSDEGASH